MNLSNIQLSMIEQNHLGHFAYLPKNLGFDVYEMNGMTVINYSLKMSEDFQRKGYSTDMMVFLMKMPKDYGCHFVTLSASSNEFSALVLLKLPEFEYFEYKGNIT